MEIQIQREQIRVDGEPMTVYMAMPEAEGKYPPVLVFMEIFGINSHIQDVVQRIAKQGYVAAAPDIYHRFAPDIELGYTHEDVQLGKDYKAKVSQDNMLADTTATIDFLNQHPKVNAEKGFGSIGFCFGGYIAYRVAPLPQISVTASCYGSGTAREVPGMDIPPVDLSDEIQGEMLCFYGGQDSSFTQEDIEMIERSLTRGHVKHTVTVYPDADHGFMCDQRASYNPEAALDAWDQISHAFANILKQAVAV